MTPRGTCGNIPSLNVNYVAFEGTFQIDDQNGSEENFSLAEAEAETETECSS
jgi:hypothetical protein